MEYLTQFKKFLKTNNGSDTHSLATLEHSSHFSPVQTATYTTLYICICRRTFSYRRNIDALVVYGNCVMTVNDGTTPTYTYIHTYIQICMHTSSASACTGSRPHSPLYNTQLRIISLKCCQCWQVFYQLKQEPGRANKHLFSIFSTGCLSNGIESNGTVCAQIK